MSIASELLPDPLGPLQTVILWRGMSTSTPLRLCCRAPGRSIVFQARLGRFPARLLARPWPSVLRLGGGCGTAGQRTASRAPAGVAFGDRGDRLGRPFGDDPAAARSPFGAEVDHPVGGLDDVEVVLDHDHRVAQRGEAVQHLEELADVVEVEAGRRLVEDVKRLARSPS